MLDHPCFNPDAHSRVGRVHLPVAPACNIQCAYCDRRYHCVSESRPGVTAAVMDPPGALAYAARILDTRPEIRVVGIAGPGEPLYNRQTFEVFAGLRRPGVIKCVSTNGLLLPERAEQLAACGVQTVTVTVNTLDAETGARLYTWVSGPKGRLWGAEGAAYLLAQQQAGVRRAAELGMLVKVNTVAVPGVNLDGIEAVAARMAALGARVMNINSVIPAGTCAGMQPLEAEKLHALRARAARYLPQFTLCKQCRADAVGIPGACDGCLPDTEEIKAQVC